MPADPFPGYADLRGRVERALAAVLEPGGPAGDLIGPGCPDRLRAAMRHSLLAGGKRLRPVLALACEGAVRPGEPGARARRSTSGSDPAPRDHGRIEMPRSRSGLTGDPGLAAAVAVELVHTYSLVHDDLPAMDDDALRRGVPTCHVAFDEATAILAGDALLTLAFGLLGGLPPDLAGPCVADLATAAGAAGMVGGQSADLAAEGDPGDAPHAGADLEAIHRRKTGALIASACTLGGRCGGADADALARLRAYGERLGLAFQIADDLLDLSQPAAVLGKTAGKDAAAGKLTYPALYGEAESRRRAETLVAAALADLAPLGPAADPLRSLARYAVDRDR